MHGLAALLMCAALSADRQPHSWQQSPAAVWGVMDTQARSLAASSGFRPQSQSCKWLCHPACQRLWSAARLGHRLACKPLASAGGPTWRRATTSAPSWVQLAMTAGAYIWARWLGSHSRSPVCRCACKTRPQGHPCTSLAEKCFATSCRARSALQADRGDEPQARLHQCSIGCVWGPVDHKAPQQGGDQRWGISKPLQCTRLAAAPAAPSWPCAARAACPARRQRCPGAARQPPSGRPRARPPPWRWGPATAWPAQQSSGAGPDQHPAQVWQLPGMHIAPARAAAGRLAARLAGSSLLPANGKQALAEHAHRPAAQDVPGCPCP